MNPLKILNKSFGTYNLKGMLVEPTYWQAAAIVFLIFLLIWTIARIRHLYVNWSLGKSAIAMLFWGFLLTLVLEGFLIISGKSLLIEVLGWKNAPKPIGTALDLGREKLISVLGVADEVPASVVSKNQTATDIILNYQTLAPEDAETVRSFICEP